MISAASLQNINTNYTSEVVPVLNVPKLYVTPSGSTEMYDMESHWFCVKDRPRCEKGIDLLENDSQHGLLLPPDKYPPDRYGPSFDYAPWYTGITGDEVPIARVMLPRKTVCNSGNGEEVCAPEYQSGADPVFRPKKHAYTYDARIWEVLGVTLPSGPEPRWESRDPPCRLNDRTCHVVN